MTTRQQKQFTTYVRVQKWKALQIEVHPMSGENSQLPGWFEDRHLQEVLQLLRGPIFERVKLKRSEIGKNMSKSAIATGPTVRIGYVFRPKPEYQMCLLPTSQTLYTSDSEEESSASTFQYRNLSLHHEKLIVYSCLLKESKVHSSMAQIMSAIGENSPQPKTVSISSYFSRVVAPGTPSQSSQNSSSTTDGAGSSRSGSHPKEEVTEPPSDSRKRKLKCIIKRSGPKLSKKAKKLKTSSLKLETLVSNSMTSRCSRNIDIIEENPNDEDGDNDDDDEFSRLSFYGDLPEKDSLVSNSKKNKEKSVIKEVDGNTAEEHLKENSPSTNAYKKCKMKPEPDREETECDSENKTCNADILVEQFHIRDELVEMSEEINFVEINNNKENIKRARDDTSHKSKSDSGGVKTEQGSDESDTSEVSIYLVETPQTVHGQRHEAVSERSNTVLQPVKGLVEKQTTLLTKSSDKSSSSMQSDKAASTTNRSPRSKDSDESFTNCKNWDMENSSKDNETKRENVLDDSDDLPKITLKKRDRSWRKSLAMMMRSPENVVEVIDCEKIDCDLMEDLAELPKHKMYLTDKFREELKQITHESELTESHIEKMVLGSKDYLRSIFMGKYHASIKGCLEHPQKYPKILHSSNIRITSTVLNVDRTRVGDMKTTKKEAQQDVNLGMFTEVQQDAVMETLMTIFCKKHHKYMDYILKVLLPEMLIWILMEIKHTSYDETEELMSGVIMK